MQNAASAQTVAAEGVFAQTRFSFPVLNQESGKTQPVAFVMCLVEFGDGKSTHDFFSQSLRIG